MDKVLTKRQKLVAERILELLPRFVSGNEQNRSMLFEMGGLIRSISLEATEEESLDDSYWDLDLCYALMDDQKRNYFTESEEVTLKKAKSNITRIIQNYLALPPEPEDPYAWPEEYK